MKDGVKIILGIIILGAIIGLCIYSTNNITTDENQVDVEVSVDESDKVVEKDNKLAVKNEVVEEDEDSSIVSSTNENVTTTVLAQNTGTQIYETSSDVGSTSEKEDAINIVKNKWGEDDSVTFVCDHVTDDGEYIIAVVSNSSAEVLNYFRVNIKDNFATLEY